MNCAKARRRHHVAIIGGGFGGLSAARRLRRADVDVTLIDRTNHHLFQPLLYQLATGILSEGDIAPPLREVLRDQRNASVVFGEVIAIDLSAAPPRGRNAGSPQRVRVRQPDRRDGREPVVFRASGVRARCARHENDRRCARAAWADPGRVRDGRGRIWTRLPDAASLRSSSSVQAQRASSSRDSSPSCPAIRCDATFGVSTRPRPGSCCLTLRRPSSAHFPSRSDGGRCRTCRTSASRSIWARRSRTSTSRGLDTNAADVSLRRIEAATKIWAAGVQASPLGRLLAAASGADLDRAGRVKVEDDCTLPNHPEVFVIGDLMNLGELPGVSQVALQSGRHAADTIRRRLKGDTTRQPFRYRNYGSMATDLAVPRAGRDWPGAPRRLPCLGTLAVRSPRGAHGFQAPPVHFLQLDRRPARRRSRRARHHASAGIRAPRPGRARCDDPSCGATRMRRGPRYGDRTATLP